MRDWHKFRGVRFEVSIPEEPTLEDMSRILLFLEWGYYPANLSEKMVWVDRYWDEDFGVLSSV